MSKIYEALERAKQARQDEQDIGPLEIVEKDSSLDEQLVVIHQPDSAIAEYFRFLRSKIIHPASGNPPRTIQVTSALTGEGKSFVSSNLAAIISQGLEEHVLLIDTDMRNPTVHKIFGIDAIKEGLSVHLAENKPLSELLKKTAIDKLTILPAGNSTKIPAELLSSEKMKVLIREVRNRYPDRFVIIDSPPLELAPESFVIANEVDAVIVVVRCGKTPRHAIKKALEKIRKEKLMGVVFNGYTKALKPYGRYVQRKEVHRDGM